MKRLTLAATLCLMSASASAFHCPMDMGEIDTALAAGTTLSEVQSLRSEGETLHNSGDHQGAVDTLAKAKAILGIN